VASKAKRRQNPTPAPKRVAPKPAKPAKRPPVVALSTLSAGIWTAVVFASVIWQPFRLGFYLDDWPVSFVGSRTGAAFSPARFHFAYAIDSSRPGLVPLRFLFSSLFADHPWLWQGALLAAHCCVAIILFRLIRLLAEPGVSNDKLASGIAMSWLLLPWTAGVRFWPVLLPNVLVLAVFGIVCVVSIRGFETQRPRALLAGSLYLWTCLSYEMVYFQWIAIVLIGAGMIVAKRARKRDVAITSAALVAAQGLAGAWYLISKSFSSTHKPIDTSWPLLLRQNIVRIPFAIKVSMVEVWMIFAALALLTLIIGGWVYVRCTFGTDRDQRIAVARELWLGFICLTAGLLSIFVFTLGGRPVAGTGVETRVLLVFSFWLLVWAGTATMFVHRRLPDIGKAGLVAVLLGMGTCLAAGQLLRGSEWATAWKLQRAVMDSVPINDLRKTEPGARILLVNRLSVNGAPIFAAPWDINSAMSATYPFLADRVFVVYSPYGGPMIWTGSRLSYPGQPPVELGSALYVWKPAAPLFFRATVPFRVNPDLSIDTLR
jgi:hypothetical protein